MRTMIAGLASGLVFGIGLTISGMTQPSRVLGFLDLLGNWDPTLAIVIASALLVVAAGFALATRRDAPLIGSTFAWPDKSSIDRSLIAGAALFGIGWGLVGLCPGPALVNLAALSPKMLGFVVAMATGARTRDVFWRHRASRALPA